MSNRLQILIAPELDVQLIDTLERNQSDIHASDAVARLAALNTPTAEIGQMLAEIEAGRY